SPANRARYHHHQRHRKRIRRIHSLSSPSLYALSVSATSALILLPLATIRMPLQRAAPESMPSLHPSSPSTAPPPSYNKSPRTHSQTSPLARNPSPAAVHTTVRP